MIKIYKNSNGLDTDDGHHELEEKKSYRTMGL